MNMPVDPSRPAAATTDGRDARTRLLLEAPVLPTLNWALARPAVHRPISATTERRMVFMADSCLRTGGCGPDIKAWVCGFMARAR